MIFYAGALYLSGIVFYNPSNYSHDRKGDRMAKNFTLEYWLDDDWYVGMLKLRKPCVM
jgi:hypothetical protein